MSKITGPDRVVAVAGEATGAPKALVKGLALVDMIARAGEPVRLPDLVSASNLPRTTVLRLLDALCEHSVLRVARDGRYQLGSQLAVWGQRYLDRLDIREAALDIMQQLAAETTETCFLGMREGHEVRYVGKVGGSHAVRLAAEVGSRMPLHSTGIGKALLAFAPQEVVDGLLAQPLEARTANTITSPAGVGRELAAIRSRGYAIDDVENEEGVRCVAVPVRGPAGDVVAALSVSAPAYRFRVEDLHRLAPRMILAAAEVSARMGFVAPAGPAE